MTEASFDQIKTQIIENLSNGLDFSPKGSIDIPVRDFVSFINALPDYVTTSSCSGRISVSYPLGESKGVNWTLVKHGFVTVSEVFNSIQQPATTEDTLYTLKCEPFIMHLCCRDLDHAKLLHHIAMECGYRESGITVGNRRVMLAIRTTSFHMELPIAKNGKLLFQDSGNDDSYLHILVQEANQRLRQNLLRTDRLLHAMKQHFQYPTLKLLSSSSNSSTSTSHEQRLQTSSSFYQLFGKPSTWWNRWGHMIIPLRETNDFIVIGGHGIESNHVSNNDGGQSNQKSGRNVVSFAYSDYLQLQKKSSKYALNEFLTKLNPYRDIGSVVHGRGIAVTFSTPSTTEQETQHKFLLISGGRLSPQRALDALQVYYFDQQLKKYIVFTSVEVAGDEIPAPRWGHTFIQLTENTFFLCSGRNEDKVLDDCYLLEIQIQQHTSGLSLKATWTKAQFQGSISLDSNSSQTENLTTHVFGRYFHASANILAREESEYSTFYGCNQLLIHGGMTSLFDPTEVSSEGYLINFHLKTIRPVSIVAPLSLSESPRMLLTRLGHTITCLPGKTLTVVGGMSPLNEVILPSSHDQERMNSTNPTYTIDLSNIDLLKIEDKTDDTLMMQAQIATLHPSPISCDNHNLIPCEQCRVHHEAIFDFSTNQLHIIGGGAMTLAFGDHFCSSLIVSFKIAHEQQQETLTTESSTNVSDQKHDVLSQHRSKPRTNQSSSPCIVIDAKKVKTLKTWLESKNFIEKSSKISKTSMSSLTSSIVTVVPLINEVNQFNQVHEEVGSSFMAVPLMQEFYHVLTSSSFSANPFAAELYSLLQTQSLHVSSSIQNVMTVDSGDMSKDVVSKIAPSNMVERNEMVPPTSSKDNDDSVAKQFKKRPPFVTNETKANNFLKQFMIEHSIPMEYQAEIPTKYELVGDILMIPDKSFTCAPWSAAIQKDSSKFWSNLAYFFKVNRVARKAFIHSGPMRKSQVQLIYYPPMADSVDNETSTKKKKKLCVCGEDHSSTPGWVTVIENRIKFSFDITRVMFCSGNNTERMRMGSLRIPNEVVVDFYCGIGYYTVPLLYYGQLKFLYALEWNPDSIFALKHNIAKANISPDRYQIRFGDNQVTSENLINVADRILLGLLPSSVPGWKLAARALKPSGGVLHVHENVHERDINQWVEDMKTTFHQLFLDNGKKMKLEVKHVEVVKSYAPRVYHYVIDVHCVPAEVPAEV